LLIYFFAIKFLSFLSLLTTQFLVGFVE